MLLLLAIAHAVCPSAPDGVERAAELAATGVVAPAEVLEDVACLTGPLTPAGAVWVHRASALERHAAGDTPGALTHLRSTPPGWTPADPGLQRLVDARAGSGEPGAVEPIAVPPGWRAVLDGQERVDRPADRAVVFQWLDPDRVVRASVVLPPSDPIPPPPLGAGPGLAEVPRPPPWIAERRNQALVAGGAGVAAGLGLLVGGLVVRADLPEPASGPANPDYTQGVRRTRSTANALGYAGQGLLVAGGGVLVAGAVAFR